jgi:hypothetical protein
MWSPRQYDTIEPLFEEEKSLDDTPDETQSPTIDEKPIIVEMSDFHSENDLNAIESDNTSTLPTKMNRD